MAVKHPKTVKELMLIEEYIHWRKKHYPKGMPAPTFPEWLKANGY